MKIGEMLKSVVTNAVNLQTTTCLCDVQVTGDIQSLKTVIPSGTAGFPSLVTNVNLLDGNITSCISPALLDEQYAQLRQLHQEMAAKGQEIIERNVSILRSLVAEWGSDADLPAPKGTSGGGS